MDKILLVGEQNPFGGDPSMALYPLPRGCAGDRIRRILSLTDREYLRTFQRVNLLLPGGWDKREAATRARGLWAGPEDRIVLLGAKVAAAFGFPSVPFTFHTIGLFGGRERKVALVLPHPSGRCRVWNDPTAVEKAQHSFHGLLAGRIEITVRSTARREA